MPNFSGIWTVTQQMQAKGASTWPAVPGAPTIGTATAGINNCASVTFTAPGCTGYPAGVTGYRVISTPGCFSNTGASSPVVVSGLTNGTSYTFKAQATNATGYGALSAASNSITATLTTCNTYTTPGCYTWVAPAGVTSVAVLAIGGGASGKYASNYNGGGGGGLGYGNNYSVTPLSSYSVTVGAGGACYTTGSPSNGGCSSFNACITGGGGQSACSGGAGGTHTGSGGNGGASGGTLGGGGGAGGYSGAGGLGGGYPSRAAAAGSGGGGGGGGPSMGYITGCPNSASAGGGGVGLYGSGSNGTAGASPTACVPAGTFQSGGGGGGSSGAAGQSSVSASGGYNIGGKGGAYGGGGGGGRQGGSSGNGKGGGSGAVRIVWAGGSRGTPSFPSTNVGP